MKKLEKALKLRKAKYLKKWKGKGGRWMYEYPESTGKKKKVEREKTISELADTMMPQFSKKEVKDHVKTMEKEIDMKLGKVKTKSREKEINKEYDKKLKEAIKYKDKMIKLFYYTGKMYNLKNRNYNDDPAVKKAQARINMIRKEIKEKSK